MKMHHIIITIVFFVFPLPIFAVWQVASPQATIPREPFFQAGIQQNTAFRSAPARIPFRSSYASTAFPNQYANLGQPANTYAVSISGSLKENLERIMGRYHWKVVWKAPYDYNFDGKVTGSSLPNVVEKLLQPFPLQAVMYMSNRTLAVVPRTKLGRENDA